MHELSSRWFQWMLPFCSWTCLGIALDLRAFAFDELPGFDGGVRVTSQQAASDLAFEKQVRPILKAHCFHCHGEEPELAGGLDLRLVRLMLSGGESGSAIVAGDLAQSHLWQRIATEEMPPGPKKLSDKERTTIGDWILQGARTARPEPESPADARFTEEELSHWSFQPVIRPQVPGMPAEYLHLEPIDRFVMQSLQQRGLTLAPQADRAALLRRLSFNLTGLPPTPEELSYFLQDNSPDAYQKLTERLLASPQYGVRWARHWLDVAGYAESEGQLVGDRTRPHAWRYRDYVVDAMNRDIPYDQFLAEQLAGDQLIQGPVDPNNDEHARLLAATGLLQMTVDLTQTDDTLLNRNQVVADTLATVTSTVLGLTVACAQCHDHRYDPISIEDYYRVRAVFDPVMSIHQWKKPSERLIDMTNEAARAERTRIEAEAVAVQEEISSRRRAHCQTIQDREILAAPEEVRELLRNAVNTPADQQSSDQKALLDRYPTVRSIDWIIGQLVEYDNKAYRAFEEEEKKVAAIRQTKPIDRMLMTVRDSEQPTASHVLFRGDPKSPTAQVRPGELAVLTRGREMHGLSADTIHNNIWVTKSVTAKAESTPQDIGSDKPQATHRRLAYARQLTDGTHPLVARVIVNRIWQHHFGQGLVRTPGDFGLNGQPPTHPELLDWLADDLVQHGWSLKHLHRRIVHSLVYRQVSGMDETPDALSTSWESDPENRWFSRMNLRRLDAEALRDAILSVSGQLSDRLSGPSVLIEEDAEGKTVIGSRILRDGLLAGVQEVDEQARRRSLYLSAHRSLQLNMLQTFDLPTMNPNCQQRASSTVAQQALLLMNDPWVLDAADKMALRAAALGASEEVSAIDSAYRLAFGLPPTERERELSQQFLDQQTELFRHVPDPEWQKRLSEQPQAAEHRGLASLCQMLMASNRFMYLQ